MLEIVEASLKSSGGFLVSLVLGALSVKILATELGPAGLGLFSLLRQIHQACVTVASFGGQNTISQGLASRRHRANLGPFGASVLWVLSVAALVMAAGFVAFAPQIAGLFGGRLGVRGPEVVRWLAVPVAMGIMVVFLNGTLTAWRDVVGLSLAQAADATLMCLLAWPAARLVQDGNPSALVWLMTLALSGTLVVAFRLAWGRGWLHAVAGSWRRGPQFDEVRAFFCFALGALAATVVGTGTLLAVRTLIARQGGLAAAGLFDTSWSLSQFYVWLLMVSVTTWYLPTLAHLEDPAERAALITKFMRFVVVVMTPAVMVLSAVKPLVIEVLYTPEFLPALDLWRWLILGDYLRATGWVLAMTAFARADMRTYTAAELAWNGAFLALAAFSLAHGGGLEGLGPAYVVLHAAYLGGFSVYARRHHGFRPSRGLMLQWGAGLGLVFLASLACWHQTSGVNWLLTAGLVLLGGALVWAALTPEERAALVAHARWRLNSLRRP